MKKTLKHLLFFLLIVLTIGCIGLNAEAKTKISHKKLSLVVLQKKQLSLTGNKEKVKWKSSNKSIATVDKRGNVKGKKVGKVTITAFVGDKKYNCKVSVKAGLDKEEVNLQPNEKSSVKLCGTKVKKVAVDNDKVASIDSNGTITALTEGTCKATFWGQNKKKYSVKINVTNSKSTSDKSNNDQSSDNNNSDNQNHDENDNQSTPGNTEPNPNDNSGSANEYKRIDNAIENNLRKDNPKTESARIQSILNTLDDLTSQGLIRYGFTNYDKITNSISYKSASGGMTIINLNKPNNYTNSAASVYNTSISQKPAKSALASSGSGISMKIMMGFVGRTDTASTRKPKWNAMGINTSTKLINQVGDMKDPGTADIYIFSGHGGIHYNTYNTGYSYICTPEKLSDTRDKYYEDAINSNLIYRVECWINDYTLDLDESCYAITPDYIKTFYSSSIKDGSLVLMENCYGFGDNSQYRDELARAFKSAGAGAVVGFTNSVMADYSLDFYEALLRKMVTKKVSAKEALRMVTSDSGLHLANDASYKNDNSAIAYPYIYGDTSLNISGNKVNVSGTVLDEIEDDFDNDGKIESFIVTTTQKNIPEDRFECTFTGTRLWYIDDDVTEIIPTYTNYPQTYYLDCCPYTLANGTKIIACSYNYYASNVEDISDEIYVFENGKFVSKGIYGYITNVQGNTITTAKMSSYVYKRKQYIDASRGQMDGLELKYKYIDGKFVEVSDKGTHYSEEDIIKMAEKYAGITPDWFNEHGYDVWDDGDAYGIAFYYIGSEFGHHQYDYYIYKASGKGYEVSSITEWLRPSAFIDFSIYAK